MRQCADQVHIWHVTGLQLSFESVVVESDGEVLAGSHPDSLNLGDSNA